MSRPRSIFWFELTYLLAMGLNVLTTYLTWDQTVAQIDATPGYVGFGFALAIWSIAFWVPLNLLLWHLAAQRRSVAAKWVIAGLALVNVYDFLTLATTGNFGWDVSGSLQLAFYLTSFVALWFLFRPDSSRWFEARDDHSDIFT